jgi:probable O-glycosylation ligase (exosortase A-associated)
MRDVLVLGVFMGVLPFALRHTWIGVLLWTWVSMMNPHKLTFGFAYDAPFAAVAAGVTLLSMFFSRDKLSMPSNLVVKLLIAFVIWMCVTTAFSFFPALSWDQLSKVLKIQLMTVVALIALKERKHIELFIWVNVLSIGFYGIKGGFFTIRTGGGGRVWGPPGGFIEGNNELAVALVMVIPLMNFLRLQSSRVWVRYGLLALMLLSAVAALGTQSRGALLAVSAMAVMMWFRSAKKAVAGVFVGGAAMAMLAFMPSSWETRMNTIETFQNDSSAMGRIEAWKMTISLANRQFFGGGFEIYRSDIYALFAPDSPHQRGAHSIYFSVLGEHGYLGLILFLGIWALAFRTANQIRRQAMKQEETLWLHSLASMCQVSLVGYLVGGAFLSLAYFDLPYNILVVLVVSFNWLTAKRWESEPAGDFDRVKPPILASQHARRRALS